MSFLKNTSSLFSPLPCSGASNLGKIFPNFSPEIVTSSSVLDYRLTSIMVKEIPRKVAAFFPRRLFLFDSNNGPFPGHSSLGQMKDSSVQVPTCGLLVQYLAKGHRLDFNNFPWDNLNSGRILAHWRLFESDPINGPSPGHFNLGQMVHLFRSPTYGLRLLVGAISGQGPKA